jgi:hypothetical protein
MTSTATLQAQLVELEKAYRSGVRSLQYDGRSVTYADADAMRAAIGSLKTEIARAVGTP